MKVRIRATLVHFACSALVASGAAALVFGLWYPSPFNDLFGGKQLFFWLVTVDVIIGPMLTFVVFNTVKPRSELIRDLGVIVFFQLAAMIYGLYVVTQARPVWVACEGDRFRVVRYVDIDLKDLGEAPESLRSISWFGPQLLSVRLAQSSDPEYLNSVQASAAGHHPAFRPGRWQPYDEHRQEVAANALKISALKEKKPEQAKLIEDHLSKIGREVSQVSYMPLIAGDHYDWVVVLDGATAQPLGYVHADGWLD